MVGSQGVGDDGVPEECAEAGQGVGGLALDGALGAAERGSGLRDAQVLVVAQHDGGALPRGQLGQGVDQQRPVREVVVVGLLGQGVGRVARCATTGGGTTTPPC